MSEQEAAPITYLPYLGDPASPDSRVFFQLVEAEGVLVLRTCSAKGERIFGGNILSFKPRGTLKRFYSCTVPGLLTDERGRVVVD